MWQGTTIKHREGICQECFKQGDGSQKRLITGLCVFHKGISNAQKYTERAAKKQKQTPIVKALSKQVKVKKESIKPVSKDKTINDLIDDLDTIVSLYVRIRDADENGFVTCISCPTVIHYKEADAAHFISRKHLRFRFDAAVNIRSACTYCNRVNQERHLKVFEEALRRDGIDVEWLKEEANLVCKPSISDLKELIIEIRQKLEIVKRKLL